jgi:hypothetical protein
MNHTLSDSQLEEMIKSAVNSSGPLPPDEKFSQLISALRELQERRKAAMDSEPVTEVLSSRPGNDTSTIDRALPVGTTLYHHAQQPVVPDYSDPRDAFETVFPMPKHAQRCGGGYAVTSYGAWTAYEFVKKWEGWDACRASMLNGDKS